MRPCLKIKTKLAATKHFNLCFFHLAVSWGTKEFEALLFMFALQTSQMLQPELSQRGFFGCW